jgi:hypothetical protein
MRIIKQGDNDYETTLEYMNKASKEAQTSLSPFSKSGALLVQTYRTGRVILGRGNNSPPGNKPLEYFLTHIDYGVSPSQRAIIDARDKTSKASLIGSTMYLSELDSTNNLVYSDKPFSLDSSKLALDNDIEKWVLHTKAGLCEYTAEEFYNICLGLRE